MSWWIIRSYPYPQHKGIPEVVTIFWYIKKTNSNFDLGNGTYLGTIFIHFKIDFSMIYLSFLYINMLFIRQYHIS